MTLLSRFAETVFWMGRYVERAEDLARAIAAREALCLDLPDEACPEWSSFSELCGGGLPSRGAEELQQEVVVAFLVVDEHNPGSVMRAVRLAKEDLRRCRAVVPREAWSTLNAVHEKLLEAAQQPAAGTMSRLLGDVVQACQQVSAQIAATMSHDAAYAFWRVGRYLERANMSLRIAASACRARPLGASDAYEGARWGELLHAVGAYQMYRRANHARASEAGALGFVLGDPRFPRSYRHCLEQVARELRALPGGVPLADQASALRHAPVPATSASLLERATVALASVANLADAIEDQYFHSIGLPAVARHRGRRALDEVAAQPTP